MNETATIEPMTNRTNAKCRLVYCTTESRIMFQTHSTRSFRRHRRHRHVRASPRCWSNLGFRVSGSDLKKSEVTDRLEELGVRNHRRSRGGKCRRRARRRALDRRARRQSGNCRSAARSIPVIPRAEMLAELMRLKPHTVAVCRLARQDDDDFDGRDGARHRRTGSDVRRRRRCRRVSVRTRTWARAI